MGRDTASDDNPTNNQRHPSSRYVEGNTFSETIGTLAGIATTVIESVNTEITGDQQTIPRYPYRRSISFLGPRAYSEVENSVLTGGEVKLT